MPRRVELPEELAGSFSVSDARRAGIGYGRLRSKDLIAPFHGVRSAVAASTAVTPEDRVRAAAAQYAPRLRDGQFFCNSTALAIHHLPLPGARTRAAEVHVGTTPPRRAPRAAGVRGHQLAASVVMVDSLPVCDAVEAWLQCAPVMNIQSLVVVADALVRRQHPSATMEQLERSVAALAGRPGAVMARTALLLVRPGTDSPPETLVRLMIVKAGLPEPMVNEVITGERGEFLGLGDLVYPQWKVVVEYDGGYHFDSDAQIHRDIDRLARFTAAGWIVVRVHKFHLASPATITSRIAHALRASGWAPTGA
ncbi:MAG: hypothetical protein ACOH10_13595 [Rhodoglobus sp.]